MEGTPAIVGTDTQAPSRARRRGPRTRTRRSTVAGVVIACALVVLGLPPLAAADITTGCGTSTDQPTCERVDAMYALLRDGNAIVQINQTTSDANTVALSATDRNRADAAANVIHGDMWIVIGLVMAGGMIGFLMRGLFFES